MSVDHPWRVALDLVGTAGEIIPGNHENHAREFSHLTRQLEG